MFLTMRKAYDEIATLDEPHVGKLCSALAYGARLGARGNSGVILSEWWRGFAETLGEQELFDSISFAAACKRGVDRAYKGTFIRLRAQSSPSPGRQWKLWSPMLKQNPTWRRCLK